MRRRRYIVTVEETHSYTYEVKARSTDEAEDKAGQLHGENRDGPDNPVPDITFTAALSGGDDEEE